MRLSHFIGMVILGVATIIFSCGKPQYLDEHELLQYTLDEDHGLSAMVSSNDVQIRLVYKPTDLLVYQELKNDVDQSAGAVSRLRAKYDPYYYFILSLSRSGKEVLESTSASHGEFNALLQTLAFRMGEVVNVTTAQDTVPLTDFVYNRTFGLGSSTDVLLVFSRKDVRDDETLQINLNEFGLGAGHQSFRFRIDDLETAPRIFEGPDDAGKQ